MCPYTCGRVCDGTCVESRGKPCGIASLLHSVGPGDWAVTGLWYQGSLPLSHLESTKALFSFLFYLFTFVRWHFYSLRLCDGMAFGCSHSKLPEGRKLFNKGAGITLKASERNHSLRGWEVKGICLQRPPLTGLDFTQLAEQASVASLPFSSQNNV